MLFRSKKILNLALASMVVFAAGAAPSGSHPDWTRFLNALQRVETGGEPNGGEGAIGDGGNALGPFQIHEKGYWKDAIGFDRTIGGEYKDCAEREYSEKIVMAYLDRYARGQTPENMARIHNGGPKGATKKATDKYAAKFNREYNR